MSRRRIVVLRPNGGRANGLKPIEALTDRGMRYRANREGVRPPGPKVCGYCGSENNVGVEHVDGREENCNPANLLWGCKSCNGRKAALFKRLGLGRRVRQYNGDGGKVSLKEYGDAIKVMRGAFEGNVEHAMDTIHRASPAIRSKFSQQAWKSRRARYGPAGRDPEKFTRIASRQMDIPF